MEDYRPLSHFVRQWAVLVLIGLGFVACGGWVIRDALVNVRGYVHGTLTIERCDQPTGTTRCTGAFRADDGYVHRAGVTVRDVPGDAKEIEGWLDPRGGTELVSEYDDLDDRGESGNWGDWRYHVFLGTAVIIVGLGVPGWIVVGAWWKQRRRPTTEV